MKNKSKIVIIILCIAGLLAGATALGHDAAAANGHDVGRGASR